MSHTFYVGSPSLSLFLGMLFLMEIGRVIGVCRLAEDPKQAKAGFGAIEGGVLALLGLLLAFTFSGAGARFDTRRQLIVEETNAIGTLISGWTCFQPESNLCCGKISAVTSMPG